MSTKDSLSKKSAPAHINIYHAKIWVPAPIDLVWEFFSHLRNFEELTPKIYGLTMTSDKPVELDLKFQVKLSLLGKGGYSVWNGLITDLKSEGPDRYFVDELSSGLIKFWKHKHKFISGSEIVEGQKTGIRAKMFESGTWIEDYLEYALTPVSAFDKMGQYFSDKALDKFFSYRYRKLQEIFSV